MEGGAEGLIQVRTKTPVVAGPGDHFILRTPSPVRTIGGGRIVEAVDRRLKGSHPGVYEDLQQRAEAMLDERRFVEYCVRRAESLAVAEQADCRPRQSSPRPPARNSLGFGGAENNSCHISRTLHSSRYGGRGRKEDSGPGRRFPPPIAREPRTGRGATSPVIGDRSKRCLTILLPD